MSAIPKVRPYCCPNDEGDGTCAYHNTTPCDNCGEYGDVREVEYDAMVDGPGYIIIENRCANCRTGRSQP